MHSFFILCKNTKNKNQMFIFYVSLTLYKLFDSCQAEDNGVFLDSCYFCKVPGHRTCRVVGGQVCVLAIVCRLCPGAAHCLQQLPLCL